MVLEITQGKRISIETFKVRLPKKKQINLLKACDCFSKEFNAKYNPESGIQGLFVTVEEITFCVYTNGTVCAYGGKPAKIKLKAFEGFWDKNLRKFVGFF